MTVRVVSSGVDYEEMCDTNFLSKATLDDKSETFIRKPPSNTYMQKDNKASNFDRVSPFTQRNIDPGTPMDHSQCALEALVQKIYNAKKSPLKESHEEIKAREYLASLEVMNQQSYHPVFASRNVEGSERNFPLEEREAITDRWDKLSCMEKASIVIDQPRVDNHGYDETRPFDHDGDIFRASTFKAGPGWRNKYSLKRLQGIGIKRVIRNETLEHDTNSQSVSADCELPYTEVPSLETACDTKMMNQDSCLQKLQRDDLHEKV